MGARVVITSEYRACDFGCSLAAIVDGKTKEGPWAYMCAGCWSSRGVGRLGVGRGQLLVVVRPGDKFGVAS